MDAVTVTLGRRTITLAVPTDLAAVVDCITLSRRNAVRASYMALALCVPAASSWRPRARYSDCGYDPGQFAGAVLDELVSAGVPMPDILSAGTRALGVVAAAFPRKGEVAAAEGFSNAQEES